MGRQGLGRFALGVLGAVAWVGLQGCGSSSPASPTPSTAPTSAGSPAGSGAGPEVTPTPATPSPGPTPSPSPPGPFALTSPSFVEGGPIPVAHTCDGVDSSPPLAWTGVPAGTVTFALIVDDPDAGGFVHWVVYNLDPGTVSLPTGVRPPDQGGPPQGTNSFGRVGYGGPCPPSGTHHYRFRLIAVATRLSVGGSPSASRVLAAASSHILGEALLTGTYHRR